MYQNQKQRALVALALLCLSILVPVSLQAQMVTNYPVEAPGPLSNPLMGFRNDLGSYSQYPYPTVVRQYIKWNDIENNTNDTVQKIRDYCNTQWKNLPTNNVRVIPRIYIDWDSNTNNEYWPADLTTGDWSSQAFKDRVVRLVGRLGEVWDNDPRVAWVQTGIIGYWGEQESPVGVSQDGWAQRLGSAFTNAFKNKKLVVRNMNQWPGYEMGNYWDSFAHPQQANVRATIKSLNAQGRYLSQALEGEVAYNWGDTSLFGSSPDVTLTNAANRQYMIDTIRDLHTSALGWIASYTYNNAQVQSGAAEVQKAFGYRFIITEFACSARTEPGANMNVSFKVQNTGSAPFYENWPLAVVLINETTRQMVWKATLPTVDIRTWQPGSNYNTNSRTYATPALVSQVAASVPVPASLAPGQYLVGLSILEPMSRTPGVLFAVTNFFKESQSQPLCRIGIGSNASSNTLTGLVFNDLVNDDKRYYTTNSAGPNYTLTLQSSPQGAISATPGGGSYVKDTGVQVTAMTNTGYVFTSWGGALAGLTNNPAIVVMDANKSVSANYVQLSNAYILTTSVTNGSIILNPPGGIYTTGTVVTVTANPNLGYAFGTWSGDLSGSVNPTNIMMNGNRSVTVNFAPVPTYTITATVGPNGAITPSNSVVVNQNANQTFTMLPNSGYEVDVVTVDGSTVPTASSYTFNNVTTNHAISATFKVTTDVSLLGSWVQGTTHTKEGGSNRALVVMVYGESTGNIVISSVTYSGQTMTKVVDNAYLSSGYYSYSGAFVLNEAGVAAASNGTIAMTWSGTAPTAGTDVTSTFYSGVNQSSLTGASASNGLVGVTITTAPLANNAGDMVLVGGTAANNGTYTVNNDFTRGIPETSTSFGDITSAYKLGAGTNETPSLSMSASMRQTIVAFVLKESVAAPVQYTLTTNAVNGTITLNPTGGVYTGGTVVTVTANPDNGYTFSGWSGDLSGAVSPTNITMNANKSVTANFSVQSISFLPPVLQGGQLRLEWVGGALQTANNVAGPWSDVPGAVSPYLTPPTNPAQFFRVKQ